LTYMATISSALKAGLLAEYRLPEHDGRTPVRPLFLAPALFDWVDSTDELYEKCWSSKSGGRSRFEHLEQAFGDFRCDMRPLVGDLNRLMPTKDGIWKLHSPGVRILGWVPYQHAFVGVVAAFAEDTHGSKSQLPQLVQQVRAFASTHGLVGTIQRGDRSALFPTPA
jgi:hypothetical protein